MELILNILFLSQLKYDICSSNIPHTACNIDIQLLLNSILQQQTNLCMYPPSYILHPTSHLTFGWRSSRIKGRDAEKGKCELSIHLLLNLRLLLPVESASFLQNLFCPKFASQSPVAKICTDGVVSSRLFGLCQISKSLSMMLSRQESVYRRFHPKSGARA